MPLSHLLEEVDRAASRFRHRDHDRASTARGRSRSPAAIPASLYGLGNLVDNAVDFAKSEVRICGGVDAGHA